MTPRQEEIMNRLERDVSNAVAEELRDALINLEIYTTIITKLRALNPEWLGKR